MGGGETKAEPLIKRYLTRADARPGGAIPGYARAD